MKKEKGLRFAILGHLMKVSDLAKKFPLIKVVPERIVEEVVLRNLKGKFGFFVASHIDALNGIDGYLMAVLLTASQMKKLPKDSVGRRILDAVLFAQDKLGVELVQLGALTSSVTDGGKWVAERPEFRGYVNHGDTYTAAAAVESIEKIAELTRKDLTQSTISIVGAYGTIGEAVSKLLISKCKKLILVGRKMERFAKLKDELPTSNYRMTTVLGAVKEADIVITVTNHPTALLNSAHLKRNAIVVDAAQPPNLAREVLEERPDVIRIDGGLVNNAGVNLGFNIGLPKGRIFACIAEVIMQALEGERENHIGSIDLAHLERTKEWAKKWGFGLAPFTCFGKPISLNKLTGR